MRPGLAALAAFVGLVLLPAVPASAGEGPTPTSSKLRFEFSDLDHAALSVRERWEGAAAQEKARALDAAFGNGDGALSAAEADAAARAAERGSQGSRLDGVQLDGAAPIVARARAAYVGDGADLELRADLDLLFMPGPGGHVLVLAPAAASVIVLLPPEGWYFDTTDGQEGTVVHASRDEPESVYLLPAGVETVTVHAPKGVFVDTRTAVMGASAVGLLGIVAFAGMRRRAAG